MDVRAFIERFFAEAINGHAIDRLDEFCAHDYKWHGTDNSEALGDAMGFDEYVAVCEDFFAAFPDFKVNIREILVDENRVCVRYEEGGTHVKEFAGFPATNKPSRWSGIGIFHIRDGKIHEEWLQSNMEAQLAAMQGA
jgi:steroid delta-isomerase-like uncharacterized protein